VSASCTSYALESAEFRRQLATNPKLSENVIYALQKEVRSASKIIARTPLLRQGTGKTVRQAQTSQAPILATSFAASVESFYRSALNVSPLFPLFFSLPFPFLSFLLSFSFFLLQSRGVM